MMQKIELTPNQNLMSPLDQCHSLGLIQTPQEIESNNKFNYILTGCIITLVMIVVVYNVAKYYQDKQKQAINF